MDSKRELIDAANRSGDDSSSCHNTHLSKITMLVRDFDGGAPMWASSIALSSMECHSLEHREVGSFVNADFVLPGCNQHVVIGAEVRSATRLPDGHTRFVLEFCLMNIEAQAALYKFLMARA